MKSLKIIFPFILLLSTYSFSQIISDVNITGLKKSSVKQFDSMINQYIGKSYSDSLIHDINEKVTSLLQENGFYNSELRSEYFYVTNDSSKIRFEIIVRENQETYIKKIYFSGIDSTNLLFISRDFEFLVGKIFIQSELERTISDALDKFERVGYPFSKMKLDAISFYKSPEDENLVDIYIDFLNTLKPTFIDTIEIIGNTETSDKVILREINIKSSNIYDQQKIDAIPSRLNRLRFFQPIAEPLFLTSSKGKGILQIKVEEKQTNNFDGIIGFVPSQQKDESGYVTGMVNISMRNLFGTGRAAAFRWQKIDRKSQDLEIKYLEPWIFDFPFDITFSLNQKIQDSSFVQRRIEGNIEYRADENITVGFGLSSESVVPSLRENNVFTVYNSSSFASGLSLKIDSRDDPYVPTKGIYLFNSYWLSQKKIHGPEEFISENLERSLRILKVYFDFSAYYELFNRQVFAAAIHARELNSSIIEISDLFFLGGTNSLRGYRENQFQGGRVIWSNLEYRYLLSKRTFAFTFVDVGYYLRKEDLKLKINQSEGIKPGYGVGLNLETGLGVITVSFALAKGESFTEGKIHFGLINEF